MRLLILLTALLYSCTQAPDDGIDYDHPDVMRDYDETVLGIKKSRFIDEYDIRTDTLSISADTMMLLLTVTKGGKEVYDEVRYEVLCPSWMIQGKESYQMVDIYK
jgi:hypothetical protein